MGMGKPSYNLRRLKDGSVSVNLQPEHAAEHGDANLKSHPGEKTQEHGLGKKIGNETKAEQPREQKKRSCQKGDCASQGNVAFGERCGEVDGSSGEDGGCGGVGGNDQNAGGAKCSEGH